MILKNNATYRFICRADSSRSLNVYGNSGSTPIAQTNVCLYTSSATDTCQQWIYKESGDNRYFVCKMNPNVALDMYTGNTSGETNVNAHVYATSNTSYLAFEDTDSGYIKIKLSKYSNKYLTANQGDNGNNTDRTSHGKGNVYWYSGGLTDHSQEWKPILVDDGGSSGSNEFYWPTESHTLSQGGGYGNGHLGIDIRATTPGVAGDKIYAFTDGIVAKITTPDLNDGYGVRLHHINPYPERTGGKKQLRTQYLHFCQEPTVKKNDYVRAGQVIGYMGNTGNSYGVHLHFETRVSDTEFPMNEDVYSDYNQGTVVDPMLFVGNIQ